MLIHIVSPLLCRNCLLTQADYLADQGITRQYLAAVNVDTKTAERFVLHNDSVLVSDITTVVPIRKKSPLYASIQAVMKEIIDDRTLGILVLLPDGRGEFFGYTASFDDQRTILPPVAARMRNLLGPIPR